MADGARIDKRALLHQIATIYRARLGFLLLAALIIVVPAALLDTATDHAGGLEFTADAFDDPSRLALLAFGLVSFVGATIGHEFYAGVVGSTAMEARRGNPPLRLREVLGHLPLLALVGVDLLYTLGLGVGLVLLIVPGVIFGTYYTLAAPVVKIEHLGVRAAFRRSRELVRNHFWLVLVLAGGAQLLGVVITFLALLAEEVLVGESFVADWVTAAAVDMATLPIYGVVVSVIALELIDLKGPRVPSAES